VKTMLFLGAEAAYLLAFRGPLMKAFQAKGYRIVAVAPVPAAFDTARYAELGIDFVPWPMGRAALNPFAELKSIYLLWQIIKRTNPDTMFAHAIKPVIYGLILARMLGVRRRTAMIPGLGYAFTEGGGLKRLLVGLVARFGYRVALAQAHMVIFQNPDDLAALRLGGVLPATVPVGLVNGSGVNMTHYAPAPWPPGPPRFLMVARLLRDKGVREFVDAARIVRVAVPDAQFVLVGGTDPNPAAIRQDEIDGWLAEGLIEARGHLADPRAEYAACHVHVLPSYREGTPRSNLEAMAMARAIVTTDVPGCRETVVDGVNGLLVTVRDPRSLATAMQALALDLDRARAMGKAGLKICRQKYELEAVTKATLALIID